MPRKAHTGLFAVAAILFSVTFFAFSDEKGKSKEASITGEILDLACYMTEDESGPAHKQCAIKCAKQGIPIGILDKKSKKVYLILPGHSKEEMHDYQEVGEKAGTEVTLKGMVFEKPGLSVISLASGHEH